jgi:membrane-associated HD superfamily phosphohydrolase
MYYSLELWYYLNMNKKLISVIIKVGALSIIVFSVSAFFIYDAKLIGWVIFALGLLCITSLFLFNILIINVWPVIVFGLIDNGILAILAVIGAEIAGVVGAIIGGAVGNAITDGIAGVFEGSMAERLRERKISEERTMLGSSIGKMAGCLLGAGMVLIIANFVNPRL